MDMYNIQRSGAFRGRRAQAGAVLYVALIMLILMALIGIVGMQVTGMQERMAANYLATNIAFQNAEGVARSAECAVEQIVDRDSPITCTAVTVDKIVPICDDGFDPGAWGEAQSFAAVPAVNVRKIDQCIQGEAPLDEGGPKDANPFPVYQITAYAADSPTNPTSSSVIDTVFKL